MKIFLLIFFSACMYSTHGQNKPDATMQDVNAEPYLGQIAQFFNPAKAIQIKFKYEITNLEATSKITDNGSIIIKGDKYKLKIDEGEIFFNGTHLWVYNESSKEVYKSIPDTGNLDNMMLAPFRMIKDYKTYYKYRLKEDLQISGTEFAQVELYPIDLHTSLAILKILINKKTGKYFTFSMQQKSGIVYTIYSQEIITDVKINDNAFSWDKTLFPDVLEVEM